MTTKNTFADRPYFRATVYAECTYSTADPRLTNKRHAAACDKMQEQESLAKAIAKRHYPGVDFESQDTQVHWQAAFRLESDDEEKLRQAVAEIEAIEGLRLQGGTARRVPV